MERKSKERKKRTPKKKKTLSSKLLLKIIAGCLLLLALQSCADYWIPPTYKYKVVHVGEGREAALEKYADEGWELHETTNLGCRLILKKRAWFIERFF
jgi:hypothetical protein